MKLSLLTLLAVRLFGQSNGMVMVQGTAASGATDNLNPVKVGGKYNVSPITLTNGQRGDLQLDVNGYLKFVCISGCSGGGGGGGTSSTFGGAFPTTGTAAGFIDSGGNMAGGNLTAGGAVKVDASAVTQPVSGTFWQATQPVSAAALPLPSGAATLAKQPALGTAGAASTDVISVQGIASMTALKVDGSAVTQPISAASLPLPSGAATVAKQPALGTAGSASADVITVQGAASMTKLLVTPDSVALPANQSVNVNQLAGTTTDTNSGTKSAGTLRVVLATDQPALTNKLLVTPDSVALPANQSVNVGQLAGTTTDTNSGSKSAGTLRVVLATDQPALTNKLLVTPDSVALPSNQSVNVSQINAVTPLMGNGITGTGSPRVTIASDNTAFAVNATLGAETTKVVGTVRALGNGGATLDSTVGAGTAPANQVVAGALYNSTEIAPTTGQAFALQADAKGRLRNVLMDAAGNTRGANVDANNNLGVVLAAETTKVLGTVNLAAAQTLATVTSLTQFNGNAIALNTGTRSAGTLRVTVATDDVVPTSQSGTWTVQPGNTANTTAWLVQPVPGTANGLTWYNVEPAASDNHVNIKNGAGNVYHIQAFNNSATVNYLRLYNAATGFNGCNSATNLIYSAVIPGSTSGAGFVADIAEGITFSTGISICVSSAYGQTATTNATASAMEINVGYK